MMLLIVVLVMQVVVHADVHLAHIVRCYCSTNVHHTSMDHSTIVAYHIVLLLLVVSLSNCRLKLYSSLQCVLVVHICSTRLVLVLLCVLFLCLCLVVVLCIQKDCQIQLDFFHCCNPCFLFLCPCILRSSFLFLCLFLCTFLCLCSLCILCLWLLICPLVLILHLDLFLCLRTSVVSICWMLLLLCSIPWLLFWLDCSLVFVQLKAEGVVVVVLLSHWG